MASRFTCHSERDDTHEKYQICCENEPWRHPRPRIRAENRVDLLCKMTLDRKLALVMGKFTAEDAIKSFQNPQRIPELVPVEAGTETLRV
jgi:hypothetical protein